MVLWLKYILFATLLMLYIVGEYLIAILGVTISLPVNIWRHWVALHKDYFP
jgi:hypothetical protein